MFSKIIVIIFLVQSIFQVANSANILALAFVGGKSHRMTYVPLLYELGARGHNVTIVSYTKSSKLRTNVREILTLDSDAIFRTLPDMYEMRAKGEDLSPFNMVGLYRDTCVATYDLPEVKNLLNQKFDLIFLEVMNDCVAGLVYKLKPTSFVLLSPISVPSWISDYLGSPSPPSFVPNLMGRFTDRMTFLERVINFFAEVLGKVVMGYYFTPIMEKVYREKLNDTSIPSAEEIYRNASMIFSASHFSIHNPRPFLPDIVEVGGMHLNPAKPLPESLASFADNSGPNGFIFFSLGSALQGSQMPEEKRQIFLRVFSKLKQRVIWKWETETMTDLPPNVKLSKWLPQQDVLGHPNCKLFITHGGLGGTTEAIYHGIPMVGIPMFGDQTLNIFKAEKSGYALYVDYNALSEEGLSAVINQVLTDPKFGDKIRNLSNIYSDQPEHPLDRAVFWTEYLLRHNGAPHLRSPARDLNFFQYHSIDVILTILGILIGIVFIVFVACRLCVRQIRKPFLHKSEYIYENIDVTTKKMK